MKPVVLFVYGEGGHQAQANRLASLLIPELRGFDLISFSDSDRKYDWSKKHYVSHEVRNKHSKLSFIKIRDLFEMISCLKNVRMKYRPKVIISTGPGVSIISSVYFKIFGAKIIHLETWSRFSTKSLTGRVMYYISDQFLVQNKSLLEIYPKAQYSGRL